MDEQLNRRDFLCQTAATTCGCLALTGRARPAWARSEPNHAWTRQVDFYEQLSGNRIQCFVCPLHCTLFDGETCFCQTRTNHGGKLYTHAYNNPCIISVDPIEKLPLNHYRPGTKTLSIAVGGCNLRCLYCQNWQQSQERPERQKTFALTPQQAVQSAVDKGIKTIAFTYTEPVSFLEYAKDIAKLAKQKGLSVVAATAGYIDPEPLLDFAQYVDAFTVALKGFTEEFYKVVLGSRLWPVQKALIALRRETRCWLEITNLVVPTYNDDPKVMREMCLWIKKDLGTTVPLHFARFVPMYKLGNLPRTPVRTLETARDTARKVGLQYVYTSNVAPHDGNNTYCVKCKKPIIQRLGFKVTDNRLTRGGCPRCRCRIPGRWA